MIDQVFSIPWDAATPSSLPLRSPAAASTPSDNAILDASSRRTFIGDDDALLVRHAAEAILTTPPPYNPIVFCGPTAVGKSVLALSVADEWQALYPAANRYVVDGVDLTRAFRAAQRADTLDDFRARLRQARLLLIDHFEQIGSQPELYKELTAAVDDLIAANSLVLVVARCLPNQLPEVPETLTSRLMSGLAVPFRTPGPTARRFLIQRMIDGARVQLTQDAFEWLYQYLSSFQGNGATVPAMQNVIADLAVRLRSAELRTDAESDEPVLPPLDAESVRKLLSRMGPSPTISLDEITKHVCRTLQLKSPDVRGPLRRSHLVRARAMVIYLAKQLTPIKYSELGAYLGNRDHSTIISAYERAVDLYRTDEAFRSMSDDIQGFLERR